MRFGSGGPSEFFSVRKDDPQKCIDPDDVQGLGNARIMLNERISKVPFDLHVRDLKNTPFPCTGTGKLPERLPVNASRLPLTP